MYELNTLSSYGLQNKHNVECAHIIMGTYGLYVDYMWIICVLYVDYMEVPI